MVCEHAVQLLVLNVYLSTRTLAWISHPPLLIKSFTQDVMSNILTLESQNKDQPNKSK